MRDLNDLNLYVAVVAHGGFSAAGRALDTPKSRLSRRVAALEQQLGVRLLERSTRRFRVTEIGHDVYRHARAALSEVDAIDEVASKLRAEPQGLVRISCPMDLDRLLGAALPEFLAQHPKLRVQIMVGNRRVDLIEEGVDIAVRIREKLDTDADLQVRIIGHTTAVLVAGAGFVAANGAPQTPEEIAGLPTISRTDRPGIDHWILVNAAGRRVEIAHQPRLSVNSFPSVREAVVKDLGVAFLPEYAARELLAEGVLVHLLPDWGFPEGILHLVFTSRRGLLPSVRAVIDFVARVLRPGSPGWESTI